MSKKEKILIVEDNKTLAKLLAKKTEMSLELEVDVAYTVQEAKEFVVKNDSNYFMALLDLNLPDAPDGEIVDYILSKNINVIVLTGNIDKKTKELFEQKPIVDYVFKGNMDDVNYIFSMIDRLLKNRNHKVLIVDDSIPARNNMKTILQSQQFNILVAAHGEEALRYFEDHKDISLVVSDYKMPVIDGVELLLTLRKEYSKHSLGVIALIPPKEEGVAARFLKYGANDFIVTPFSKEEFICRVNNTVEAMENIKLVSNFDTLDPLTNLLNRKTFFSKAKEKVSELASSAELLNLGLIEIDDFSSLEKELNNDAQNIVKEIARVIKNSTKGSDIVARIGNEEFAIFLNEYSKEEVVTWFVKTRALIANSKIFNKKITLSIGLGFGNDLSFDELLDEADSALYHAKKLGGNRVEISKNI
ncbi:MAG: response regulator [Campylobacteraceae bacterium]|nr:response regulator [Campylobacteraceae bacterium]